MAKQPKTLPPYPDGMPAKGAKYTYPGTTAAFSILTHARTTGGLTPVVVYQESVSGEVFVCDPEHWKRFMPLPEKDGGPPQPGKVPSPAQGANRAAKVKRVTPMVKRGGSDDDPRLGDAGQV